MTANICENYPALSPFDVRRENFHEVIKLFIRMIDRKQRLDKRENKNGKSGKNVNSETHKYSGGYLHGNSVTRDAHGRIVRPAKDDSWY